MTTRFHVGAKSLKGALSSYAKRFDALEVHLASTKGEGKLKGATLRRYRADVPPHFDFVVVAPPALAALKGGEAFEAALEETLAAIAALQARVVLLSTPTEVTPAQVWRDRIAKLVARLPTDATQVVWEPHGLWETDEAARAAKRLGVVLCVDAARDPVPAGPVAYVRLPQIGAARAYSESSLERVVDSIGERREAYVFIETTSALKECKALRKLTMGRSKKVGGGALVLRPKTAALRVRDDEQE
ncbi:MAG: DUF72 domain-containing protein [Myxococcales bacterium]|nr:DUF72 domain-containing protein [Myxococcales bacterium]